MSQVFTILIIDDDEDDQFFIKTAFEQDSALYNLQFASDGREVLANMEKPHVLPDLILLDLNMPFVNGFEVLEKLRNSASYHKVPIVILTTSDSKVDVDRAYAMGANTYITKPLSHQALIELVQQICIYWFEMAKMPGRHNNW